MPRDGSAGRGFLREGSGSMQFHHRRRTQATQGLRRNRRRINAPCIETLEGRLLLSGYAPSHKVTLGGTTYLVSVSPGMEQISITGRDSIGIVLRGTNSMSQLSITPIKTLPHHKPGQIKISSLKVATGDIGSINAPNAAFTGAATPISASGDVTLSSVSGNAHIILTGNITSLTIGSINLTAGGLLQLTGPLTGPMVVNGPASVNGGAIELNGGVSGPLQFTQGLNLVQGGTLSIAGSDLAGISVTGPLNVASHGAITVGGSLAGLSSSGPMTINGGTISIGQSFVGTLNAPALTIENGGVFSIGQDMGGTITIGDPLTLNDGAFTIGRDVTTQASIFINGLTIENGGSFSVGNNLEIVPTIEGDLVINGGSFYVGHDLTGLSVVQSLIMTGGSFTVGNDVTGTIGINGGLELSQSASFSIVRDLANLTVGQGVSATASEIAVGRNITGRLTVGQGLALSQSGSLQVGNDVIGAIVVALDTTISQNGLLSIGRDVLGGLAIGGNLTLDSGGAINVGRELDNFSLGGNYVVTSTGTGINVAGDINTATIGGTFTGKTTSTGVPAVYPTIPDLSVGLNLNNLTVKNGAAGQGGVRNAFISVGKEITGLNILHGLFQSFMYAGVSIAGTIGPDGNDAVNDSEIRSGAYINGLTLQGDVRSTFPENISSQGYPTRIIAGELLNGTWVNGGIIDNFQITGAMFDSVVAASVVPYGGNGTLPGGGYGPPPSYNAGAGPNGTYNQPVGHITGGTFGAPISYINYAPVNISNQLATGTAWASGSPNNAFLDGAINPSFSQAAVPVPDQTPTTAIPLPLKSTVFQGVYSTPHGSNLDYAGFYASDVRGVFVGALPQ